MRAFLGERFDDGIADSRRRSTHQRALTVQLQVHMSIEMQPEQIGCAAAFLLDELHLILFDHRIGQHIARNLIDLGAGLARDPSPAPA